MKVQVSSTADGYVVSVYNNYNWEPLINFGWRQGDARDCMNIDVPKMTLTRLSLLAKSYRPDRLMYRRLEGSYAPQKDWMKIVEDV